MTANGLATNKQAKHYPFHSQNSNRTHSMVSFLV